MFFGFRKNLVVLLVLTIFNSSIVVQAQQGARGTLASVATDLNNSSDATISLSPVLLAPWQQTVGRGVEYGFLAGNFDGTGPVRGPDDIAAVCFAETSQGNGHVSVTSGPGTGPKTLWANALGDNSQYTFAVDRSDFNGDGSVDLIAYYYGRPGDGLDDIRAKITYGPIGSSQTSYAVGTARGPGDDWFFPNAFGAAFISFDRNDDGFADVGVVNKVADNYLINFYLGPSGQLNSALAWNLGSALPGGFRVGDFNGDRATDLVMFMFDTANNRYFAKIFYGPDGTPDPVRLNLQRADYISFQVEDLNNDGLSDIAGVFAGGDEYFARIGFKPDLNKSAEIWPLQGDPNRSFSFLAGKFDQPEDGLAIDCTGTPGGSARLDRCGVCNGDGRSCLRCSEEDISALLSRLNQQSLLLRDQTLRTYRGLLKSPYASRKYKKFARSKIKQLDLRYREANVSLIELNPVILTCDNQIFCVEVDRTAAITSYGNYTERVLAMNKESIKAYRKVFRPTPLAKKRIKGRRRQYVNAARLQSEIATGIGQIPRFASQCE